MTQYLCAVDVGTRSARAGLFTPEGARIARAVQPIALHEEGGTEAEYRSEEIWHATCAAIAAVRAEAGIAADDVAALAFDATCSLVLRDTGGRGVALSADGRDTIAWCDHRAVAQAARCTDTGHALIRHLGGTMSPEMQTPKLLWIKENRPDIWARLGRVRDLADDLVWRATGAEGASSCTLSAKWPFLPEAGGWQMDFLDQIGLGDLLGRAALPAVATPVGTCAGPLSPDAAKAMGLRPGLPVAAGMIDAFAGALGCLRPGSDTGVAIIAGTSSTVLATTPDPRFAAGIWGPFRDAVLPGWWSREGGQSAAGALLDHILTSWPSDGAPPGHERVIARVEELLTRDGPGFGGDIHVLPDFKGNRSPLADPGARGVIHGLSLDRSFDGLAALYWRTAVSLALGLRQIADHMGLLVPGQGPLAVAGGLTRSRLFLQMIADATGRPVITPGGGDGVLLGTAMAAAMAGGMADTLSGAVAAMAGVAPIIEPTPEGQGARDRDYRAFCLMQDQRAALSRL
ncbi:FGGY family pentulose kinase [Nioella nitratireducens]|uniref:FGGY family pentulose kinase n=1 Tax=Nioella nitratireducens TaxID=1287720 RepID=UPI0008FD37F1|nr:FGGY family pentulose kinase [Nioella nitratireducens]